MNVERRAFADRAAIEDLSQGLKFAFSAGGFFWTPEDHAGFALEADAFYNLRVGPLVLAPGGRLSGYIAKDFVAFSGLATLSAGAYLGPVMPFVLGGAGFGVIGNGHDDWGVSYTGGGGLMFAIKRRLALGVEAAYQGVALTDFRATFIAARLQFAY